MVEIIPLADTLARRKRRLRLIGALALVVGVGGALLYYWLRTRSADLMNDASMAGFYKAQTRQMGELYGNMGLMTEQFFEDLRQPGTQARIIAAVSILTAIVCFYLSTLLDRGDEQSDA